MSTTNFPHFARLIKNRFDEMASTSNLYVVDSDRDIIYDTYLKAFPEGTNNIYRERTEHDCSCCKNFIRNVGNVIAIQNGVISTIWDLNGLPEPYQTVADKMSAYIKSCNIYNVFLTNQTKFGAEKTIGLINEKPITFNHFFADIPKRYIENRSLAERLGDTRTSYSVFVRGLTELKPEAVNTVLDLIKENNLYRGQEFKNSVLEFKKIQDSYRTSLNKDLFVWQNLSPNVSRFRNTVIGTLVQDLSEGIELEKAVRSFETKVAPANYKRPTALITKSMIESAMTTIKELDLENALKRRHAKFSDVSVNSVLFVDNTVRSKMKDAGDISSLLMEEIKPVKFDPTKAESISIDDFLSKILPKSSSIQLYLDNSLIPNFMSLTAPVDTDVKQLFKWNNNFAWSYEGNVTDSIKDRVKKAGGQVENVNMRVSLSWFNTDDLDLHIHEPNNHVYFGNKSRGPGVLDVDMNVGTTVRDPVENVRWVNRLKDGEYTVQVNNFRKRESVDVGFVIEVESSYGLHTYSYNSAVKDQEYVRVCTINVKNGVVYNIKSYPGIVTGTTSREQWGLKTLDLIKVDSVILSPNYWDENQVGNKHWFFILEGCKNPDPVRGIYNEFLNSNLEKHRKVFEILGDKTKCPYVEEQMSGLGFSSTRKDKVTVVVSNNTMKK